MVTWIREIFPNSVMAGSERTSYKLSTFSGLDNTNCQLQLGCLEHALTGFLLLRTTTYFRMLAQSYSLSLCLNAFAQFLLIN